MGVWVGAASDPALVRQPPGWKHLALLSLGSATTNATGGNVGRVTTGGDNRWGAAEQERQRDDEHLKLLMIGFYVLGGVTGLVALIPLIHVVMGILFVVAPPSGSGSPPPEWFGWLFIGIGGAAILIGEAMALLNLAAGRAVQQRRSRTLVVVASAVDCLQMPLGTVLGVLALVTLSRESVRAQFER